MLKKIKLNEKNYLMELLLQIPISMWQHFHKVFLNFIPQHITEEIWLKKSEQ